MKQLCTIEIPFGCLGGRDKRIAFVQELEYYRGDCISTVLVITRMIKQRKSGDREGFQKGFIGRAP